MEAPFNMAKNIWDDIVKNDSNSILQQLSSESVIIIYGKKFTGTQVIECLNSDICDCYTIDFFKVISGTDSYIQAYYQTTLYKSGNKLCDNRVTMTWNIDANNAKLVFAMVDKVNN